MKEWLPIMLGQEAVNKMGLAVLPSGRFTGYNVTIHPGEFYSAENSVSQIRTLQARKKCLYSR